MFITKSFVFNYILIFLWPLQVRRVHNNNKHGIMSLNSSVSLVLFPARVHSVQDLLANTEMSRHMHADSLSWVVVLVRRDSSAGSAFTRLTPREGGAEDDTGVPLSHYARPALTAVAGGEEKGERWRLRLHSQYTLLFFRYKSPW